MNITIVIMKNLVTKIPKIKCSGILKLKSSFIKKFQWLRNYRNILKENVELRDKKKTKNKESNELRNTKYIKEN